MLRETTVKIETVRADSAGKYMIVEELVRDEDAQIYRTYGIRRVTGDIIRDISTDYSRVFEIARLLNRCKVSREHFFDVVSDMLLE